MSDFLTEYESLAAEIARDARLAERLFSDRIDALKALTPFYVQKTKNMKPVDDNDGLPTFDNFQRNIHAPENSTWRKKIPLRSGRRRHRGRPARPA